MTRDEAITRLKSCAGQIRALGGEALYLFGSTARGEARLGSDLDLFIDYDRKGRFSALDLVAAKRLLQEQLGVEVDVTTRGGLHPLLRDKVEAEAIRIF